MSHRESEPVVTALASHADSLCQLHMHQKAAMMTAAAAQQSVSDAVNNDHVVVLLPTTPLALWDTLLMPTATTPPTYSVASAIGPSSSSSSSFSSSSSSASSLTLVDALRKLSDVLALGQWRLERSEHLERLLELAKHKDAETRHAAVSALWAALHDNAELQYMLGGLGGVRVLSSLLVDSCAEVRLAAGGALRNALAITPLNRDALCECGGVEDLARSIALGANVENVGALRNAVRSEHKGNVRTLLSKPSYLATLVECCAARERPAVQEQALSAIISVVKSDRSSRKMLEDLDGWDRIRALSDPGNSCDAVRLLAEEALKQRRALLHWSADPATSSAGYDFLWTIDEEGSRVTKSHMNEIITICKSVEYFEPNSGVHEFSLLVVRKTSSNKSHIGLCSHTYNNTSLSFDGALHMPMEAFKDGDVVKCIVDMRAFQAQFLVNGRAVADMQIPRTWTRVHVAVAVRHLGGCFAFC